jgi:hypothetical protein
MSEKTESDEFDEDEDDEEAGSEDSEGLDLDELMDDLEKPKRGALKVGEPAWRKLERLMEEKRTAELLSDFDDYDVDGGGGRPARSRGRRAL